MDKLKNLKKQWIASGLLIAILVFSGFTTQGRMALEYIEKGLGDALSPVQKTLGTGLSNLGEGFDSILHVTSLSRENKKLKNELEKVKEENRNLSDIIGRSTQLSNEATMLKSETRKFVKSYIISKNEGVYFDYFSLNKGKRDGIEVGDTVVIATESAKNVSVEGLVGKVEKVSSFWCKVRSITSEGNAVSFRTIRNSEGGVVKGLDHKLSGYAYDLYGDIVQGDEVYTSGIGDLYEPNIYLGRVEKVSNDNDKMIKNIRIEPAVNFHKLYRVFVITESSHGK